MPYLPRHENHKKKSKIPWFFIVFITLIGILIITQEKNIRLFFSGDLRQKIERHREKIFLSIPSGDLTEIYTRDYHSYTQDFIDKEPSNPASYFFKAEAYYFDLMLSGVSFNSVTLTNHINNPISSLLNEKSKNDANNMFVLAGRAKALEPEFPHSESNRFFLFLGESIRANKIPKKLYEDYSSISSKDLHLTYLSTHTWLLIYTVVRAGNTKALDELIVKNSEDTSSGKILLTDREVAYLKGLCHFYALDFVVSLNLLRKVKSQDFDSITNNSILTEAQIFYSQNLPKKGMDLLLNAYNTSGKKYDIFLEPLHQWNKEKPDLKIDIPMHKKGEEEYDESN